VVMVASPKTPADRAWRGGESGISQRKGSRKKQGSGRSA